MISHHIRYMIPNKGHNKLAYPPSYLKLYPDPPPRYASTIINHYIALLQLLYRWQQQQQIMDWGGKSPNFQTSNTSQTLENSSLLSCHRASFEHFLCFCSNYTKTEIQPDTNVLYFEICHFLINENHCK
jgi:hypothetical protein